MEIVEQGIDEMKQKLMALLNSEFRDFKINYNDLEKTRGVYAIYDGDEIIYIGNSKNLQDRLYNHLLKLSGNHDLSKEKLNGYKGLDTKEENINFLLNNCQFKIIREIYIGRLEQFAISVINPRFNHEKVRIKRTKLL